MLIIMVLLGHMCLMAYLAFSVFEFPRPNICMLYVYYMLKRPGSLGLKLSEKKNIYIYETSPEVQIGL